ncbi:MAG: phosphoribosyltransferase family protein [Polaribacter sp.]|nr:phosphoribosyltransferase family protein [Polaribacter sp.]
MTLFNDLFYLFFPNICVTCESSLVQSEKIICTHCRHDLPMVPYPDFKNNKIIASFSGRIPINMATSFLFYRKRGKTKRLIHALKYKGNQKIGSFFGNWFGFQLKQSGQFNNIDYIVPVPLHPKKLKKRGYNQLTTFGIALAKQLHTTYKPAVLIRTSSATTQTFKQRFERFSKLETKFSITDVEIFNNKHVLLIDDVITTGATLEACCKEILKSENSTISIATITYTE